VKYLRTLSKYEGGIARFVGSVTLIEQYRKNRPVTLSAAKRPGDDNARRDASLRST